jgi:hypothetical protein
MKVVALLADRALERNLAAGFEEEGVPLHCELASGDAATLARAAAGDADLGLGIGGDAHRLVLVLAAAPGRPYLEAPTERARAFARAAARVAARRPVGPSLA